MNKISRMALSSLFVLATTTVGLAQSTQKVGSATVTTTPQPNGSQEIEIATSTESASTVQSGAKITVNLKHNESVTIEVGSNRVTITNTP